MDFGLLFFLGMLGAILTVYLAKQEVVPEFRILFDTSDKEKEANRHRAHITETEDSIDSIQAQLKAPQLEEAFSQRLLKVLEKLLQRYRRQAKPGLFQGYRLSAVYRAGRRFRLLVIWQGASRGLEREPSRLLRGHNNRGHLDQLPVRDRIQQGRQEGR